MNSTLLPQMGRPSLSGLSIKELGSHEYHRQLYKKKNEGKPLKRHWTGLSHKLLGHAAYMKGWRRKRAARQLSAAMT
jgi:hypothetical protein